MTDRLPPVTRLLLPLLGLAAIVSSPAGAAPLCADASRLWQDFVESDPPSVLELETANCAEQVKITTAITTCAADYMDPKRPVYDQRVALAACAGQEKGAHLFVGIPGQPYPAHQGGDIAYHGG